jgi:cell wall-associated NlpC family hydrolase
MSRTTSAARLLGALAVSSVIALAAPNLASAQPQQSVGELRARAKQVTAELARLQTRSDQLDEAYLSAQAEVTDLQAQLDQKRAAVSAAERQLAQTTSTAKRYAIEAYVNGGEIDPLLLPTTDVADASHRQTYLASLHGDRTQAMDDVRASQIRLDDEQRSLAGAKERIDAKVAALDATKSDLQSTIARQTQLQSQVNGQLADAVRAEQARLAAAREAEALRQAKAEADRAAAAAARARAAVPPRTAIRAAASKAKDDAGASQYRDPGPVGAGAGAAIAAARSQLGVPYRWGAASPGRAFDCSGLIMWAWAQGGKSLPHSSRSLFSMSQRISADQLQPGDLVFGGNPVHHVGLYIGNGMMIHAPHTGDVVRIAGIYSSSGPVRFGRL